MESSPGSKRETTEADAAAWIARREREDWSEAEEAKLRAWIAADIHHRVAWLRLDNAWKQTARLKGLGTQSAPGTVPTPDDIHIPLYDGYARTDTRSSPQEPAKSPRTFLGKHGGTWAAAAVLGVLVLAGGYQLTARPTYRTEIGALQAVPLSDGSRVTLNTDTAIRVAVSKTERRVQLKQGEAYFEIAKDPSRPFIVDAGRKRIVVVGTQFSVRRQGSDIQVIVTEGLVRLEDAGESPTSHAPAPALLAAGMVAHVGRDGVRVWRQSRGDVEQILSWRSGYLVFDAAPLGEAVAEFNRYHARQIVIEEAAIAKIPVGGSFRAANVEGFLRLIETDFPVKAVDEGEQIILRGARGSGQK